jgi:hypothetical protein
MLQEVVLVVLVVPVVPVLVVPLLSVLPAQPPRQPSGKTVIPRAKKKGLMRISSTILAWKRASRRSLGGCRW